MQTGIIQIGDKYYFFNSNGVRTNGLQEYEDFWYYFSPSSNDMQFGWQTVNGEKNYFDKSGKRVSGFNCIDGDCYIFTEYGTIQKGWLIDDDGYRYYVD